VRGVRTEVGDFPLPMLIFTILYPTSFEGFGSSEASPSFGERANRARQRDGL